MVKGRNTFKFTQHMLRIDEETSHKPFRDIYQLDMVMVQIPTKELYELQESVKQEDKYGARADATNLENNSD